MISLLLVSQITIGQTSVFTSPDDSNGNLLLCQIATSSQSGTLQSLSFYVTTPGGNLRLGVYDASGNLLAQTAEFTPKVGWNTQPAPAVSMPAGTYCLAYHPSSNVLGFVKSSVGQGARWYSRTYGTLPATFGTSYNTTPSQWSFYATLTTTPLAAVNGTPGSPSVQTVKYGQISYAWDAVTKDVTGKPVTPTGYRLYIGTGAFACPNGTYQSFSGTTGTVSHLLWDSSVSAQVTAYGSGGESSCSNLVTGKPN